MKYIVIVKPKKAILDPQGKAIKKVAENYLQSEIKDIRVGKYFEIEIEKEDDGLINKLAKNILSNDVIEDYEVRKA
ncbi:phosphoribosylformylglycinamidine synthase subunit PurS [Hippea maritima]|uniref:Phosphoribosylformylglycinamidine synthase subunit PurS n=1 Tax=Hippea maritima (strain ATCC 700847 / DSM 10411 / MH2) TaxID=760142 RepID=F2LVM9_HIPMA|nr:phosphoribosylformylglycinamidine synthase subunit PurS [Hippea maritima]AEA33813.1 phosphoribosylformylglycinamidine synthase, purS [Hippea maritima DSM 10411]